LIAMRFQSRHWACLHLSGNQDLHSQFDLQFYSLHTILFLQRDTVV
jgi:hypothetical protein